MPDPREALQLSIEHVRLPGSTATLGAIHGLAGLSLDERGHAVIELGLPYSGGPEAEIIREVQRVASQVAGVQSTAIQSELFVSSRSITEDDPVPGAKNVILVMSGKGGVGKSTVAANLTLALKRLGAKVGLLDADIYGPSIPTMFGISGHPASTGNKILPLQRFDVKLMSIGFLLEDAKSAVVWRGPMLHGALLQFLKDVDWGKLDYLLLDLPPGTGDIALTLSQRVRSTGAVIVTTPQEVALQDVYKAVSMNQKVGIASLGVVENQSYFICDGCEKRHELFGRGGGAKVAELAKTSVLGQLPLDAAVGRCGDAGTPLVEAAPDSPLASAFVEVAARLAERVAEHNGVGSAALKIDRSGGVNRHLPIAR